MNCSRWKLYDAVIAKFGRQHQMAVAAEECMELAKELTKAIRGKESDMKIAEEIADVQICIDQLMVMFKIDQAEVDLFKQFKLSRLETFYVKGGHR
jgi:hypothetical protein